jgi:hypothetical protein
MHLFVNTFWYHVGATLAVAQKGSGGNMLILSYPSCVVNAVQPQGLPLHVAYYATYDSMLMQAPTGCLKLSSLKMLIFS